VPAPSLTRYDAHRATRALVVVLHGGKARSDAEVGGRSLSWRRSLGLARAVGREVRDDGIGLWVLRYRTAGWNGDGSDRIEDARWALDQVRAEHGDLPVAVVGHSMGGRTACRVADHDLVRGVVALAPWLPPSEPVRALAGRALHAAHGRRDHITRASDTRAYVARAEGVASEASFTDMGDLGHYLLRGAPAWNAYVVDRVRRVLAP
jgi:pimeloyl-ACP methyl ester carboxylesterase